MGLIFEWDPVKSASNRRKHGISFDEAKTVFGDPYELVMADPDHSGDEERSLSIGESDQRRLIFVVYRQIEEVVRIISAREAEADEIAEYLERRGG